MCANTSNKELGKGRVVVGVVIAAQVFSGGCRAPGTGQRSTSAGGAPTLSAEIPKDTMRRAPVPGQEAITEVDAASLSRLIRGHRGHPLLINVWSTWCSPCLDEMPMLIEVARSYRSEGLRLVLIAVNPPSQRTGAMAFLKEQGAPWPTYVRVGSEEAFIETFHPNWSGSLPATVLLNGRGESANFWPSALHRNALVAAIETVLTGPTKEKDPP